MARTTTAPTPAQVNKFDTAEFDAYVSRTARAYRGTNERLGSVTFDTALATVQADARGLLRQPQVKGENTKSGPQQGMTGKEWAARFGVTGSGASSRVTLWRRLGAAILAGVERDSETWRALVGRDLANRDGVRQAIATGSLDKIAKAANAKSQGEPTGFEEGSNRKPSPKDDPGKDQNDAPSITSFGPGNIGEAVEVLLTRLGIVMPEMSDKALVATLDTLTAWQQTVEAECHKRAASKASARRKPAA